MQTSLLPLSLNAATSTTINVVICSRLKRTFLLCVFVYVCYTCMVFTVDPLAPDCTISWRLLSGKDVWSPIGMHTYRAKTTTISHHYCWGLGGLQHKQKECMVNKRLPV